MMRDYASPVRDCAPSGRRLGMRDRTDIGPNGSDQVELNLVAVHQARDGS
jgi:hypothetical protein